MREIHYADIPDGGSGLPTLASSRGKIHQGIRECANAPSEFSLFNYPAGD